MSNKQGHKRGRAMGKRIGIFGGSFNPPHYGHFIAAFFAYHFLKLDEVWMMVTPGNPLKDPAQYAPLADRMEWCNIMAHGHPWLKPTDIEKSFPDTETANTLRRIKTLQPDEEFIWIMGADNLAHFHEWARWQDILDNHEIAVLARSGYRDDALASPAAQYAAASYVADPAQLVGRKSGWCFVDTPAFDISSSRILADLRAGKRNIRDMMPEVERSILAKGAYGLGQTPPGPRRPFEP